MQGSDLAPLVRGEQPEWRQEFFYEHHFKHPRIPPSEGVRTTRWKYMRFVDSQPLYEQLYDLAADPLEEHNLVSAADHANTLETMRAKWATWREQAK